MGGTNQKLDDKIKEVYNVIVALKALYIAYQQGSLTYHYGKIALLNAVEKLQK